MKSSVMIVYVWMRDYDSSVIIIRAWSKDYARNNLKNNNRIWIGLFG